MDPTATPLTTADLELRIQELNAACLQAIGFQRAAEDRFVEARAENDELEQELADLRAELAMTKQRATMPLNRGKEDDAPMAFAGTVFATVLLGLSFLAGWLMHR